MLHQDSNEFDDLPAAQMRVRRDEFARAIAALEARRQEESQYLAGTVAVEDTLRELQVDVSAEEVMHQIEEQRAGSFIPEKPRRIWDRDKITDLKLTGAIVLVPLLAILFGAMLYHPAVNSIGPTQSSMRGGLPQWMPPPPMMPPGLNENPMDESGFNASSVLKPLSQVGDNQPIHCNSQSLMMLFNSYTQQQSSKPYDPKHPLGILDSLILAKSSQMFDVRPSLRKPWILIKYEGLLYLRAWVAAKFTDTQAQGRPLLLHSSPQSFDPGVQPVPITIPISFRSDFGPSEFSPFGFPAATSLRVRQVHLDKHAWEKW